MSVAMTPRGNLLVIAAPSGAGKTSLVKELLVRDPSVRVSISHTTRARRPTEADGRDYFFVAVPEFQALVAQNEFLEHAQVFDNYYGTGRTQVEKLRHAGHDVILEIDWQGADQVRRAVPDCRSVFILPPSRRALEERLRGRRTDSAEVIARRLRDAESDMSHYREFDYVIVNDVFETAVLELLAVLRREGERLRSNRAELGPLVRELLGPDRNGQ
jgi:guanylate kinase